MNDEPGADPLATRVMATSSNVAAETRAYTREITLASGSGTLEVRCPNCHAPTTVTVDTALTDLVCAACGSNFSLVDHSKGTRMAPPLAKMGRFELIERLGVGSFGSVWKARDKELDRTVAIKIPRQGGMSAEEQEKFFREARAAAQLRHPNIVCVYEVGRDGDSIYIVSDFVRGVTLDDWFQSQKLTGREAAELCAKVADALQHAHDQGVVHRDLKPANIIIDGNGEPHLMDFGLARREVGEVTVTVAGQVLGTPAYMSPEQAQGESHTADRRSDVYSLGVIFFQLLTGELPFRGNVRMLIHQVIHDEPRNPRSFNDRVPRDLDTICIKCLQKDADNRYQQAGELAADMRRFLKGEPIEARPIGRAERFWRACRRNPVVASLAATAIALLVLLAGVGTVGYVNTKRALDKATAAEVATKSALHQADANYKVALGAVREMLTEVGDEWLENVPQMEESRRRLLRKALVSHLDLLKNKPNDISSRFELATAYARFANLNRRLGEKTEAEAAYNDAIKRFSALCADVAGQPEYRHQLAIAYDYFGELLRDTKSAKDAEEAYAKALSMQIELVDRFPDNKAYRQELSRTHNNYGILLTDSERFEDAENSLTEAIQLLRGLRKAYPDDVVYQEELARAEINFGNLMVKMDHTDKAEQAYTRSLKLLDDVVKQHPTVHDYSYKLAVALVNISNNAPSSKNSESYLNRAVGILQRLTVEYPRFPRYHYELANAYNSLADLQAAQKDYDAADRSLSDAHRICKELVAQHEGTAEYESLLGVILGYQAWLAEVHREDLAQADRLVQEAIVHQELAIRLNDQAEKYKTRLENHRDYLNQLRGTKPPASKAASG